MRYIIPLIIIIIALGIFLGFTNPIFSEIKLLRAQAGSYNQALGNSKMLENEKDKLVAKYNSIAPENLSRLEKFLPQNVDNIRLILEIEQIAAPYGMSLKNVKYNVADKEKETDDSRNVFPGGGGAEQNKEYGVFDLEFDTTGSYNNFINFTKDLENNLRIVDVASIAFTSEGNTMLVGEKVVPSGEYTYNFKIKTYWLKN